MFGNKIKHGDEFVAVKDGKGGYSLKPKKKKESGEGAGILILALLLIIVVLAAVSSPLILAFYALYTNNESSQKMRIYSIGIFIGMLAALYLIFPQIESLKNSSEEILSYGKLVNFFWILNGFGVISSIAGLTNIISNKSNSIFTIVAATFFILIAFIANKDAVLSGRIEPSFTNEQLINACDCYNNSFEVTKIPGDDLSSEDRESRIRCSKLFEPKDFKFPDNMDIVYQNMKDACEASK
jgi:hypothetical protein